MRTTLCNQLAIAGSILASIATAMAAPTQAAGDLLVAPTRVVIDGTRGTEVVLNNIGNELATYRISLELRRMTPSGQLVEVATPNATEQTALGMVAFAPRKITLAPNQPQAIRIGIRPPADWAPGEYRAHMLFRAIPDARAVTAPAKTGGVSIALTAIYGVSIPIIVRNGDMATKASLSDVRLTKDDNGRPAISFAIHRSGKGSVFGNLRITRPGAPKPLVEVRGVAVYPEIDVRTITLPISPDFVGAPAGTVKIEYLAEDTAGGGTLAETQAVLR